MQSRRERIYNDFPDPVIGYELNPERGLFSVILPEATTNIVSNPSFYGGVTTGYTAVAGAIAAIATWQAYGAYGLRITPAAATESGVYYGTVSLTSGLPYTASVTIQGEAGKKYYLYFATTAGAVLGAKMPFIATGHKQRISVTYQETSSTTRRIYLTRDAAYGDTNYFYADGFQVEQKAYPTTFCDGDMVGFLVNEQPAPYLWAGTPHASFSTRSAQTRTGGREMNLLDLGLRILAIIGLGMIPLVDQSLPVPGAGELPQGTGTMARNFSLVAAVEGDGSRQLQGKLSDLEDAFKPELVVRDQPLILRYQAFDEDNEPCGDSLDIICKYRTGLEGNFDNNNQQRLALGFKMYLPYIKSTFSSGVALGYQTTVADADYILLRTRDGVWTAMETGADGIARDFAQGQDGYIYMGGSFLNLPVIGSGGHFAKFDGSVFSRIGGLVGPNADVNAVAIGPDGKIYIGGSFSQVGGAAFSRIAFWDGAAWNAMGVGADNTVLALAWGKDGFLYAGGSFTSMGGVADTKGIARWNGVTWNSLGTGIADQYVMDITIDPNDNVYIGGNFSAVGGVANTLRIAKWNGLAWESLGAGANAQVNTLRFNNGILYAGGDFTTMNGVSIPYLAAWNGVVWSKVGDSLNARVRDLAFDLSGMLYAGGDFSAAGSVNFPDSIAYWNGSVWLPADVNLPGAANIYAIRFDKSGNMYIGFDTSGSATSATVGVSVAGSSIAYPTLIFTGPGTVWQIKNYTTGKSIFFNLTLLAGEVATLNLDPFHLSFTSSFRGNMMSTILQGSDLDWFLIPGSNSVSAYMFGSTTAATAITMHWLDQLDSVNRSIWK